jgi:hypothetical protein
MLSRIRIHISLDYRSGSCSLFSVAFKKPRKNKIFFQNFFCLNDLVYGAHLVNISFRRYRSKLIKDHKTVEKKVFLNFLLVDGRIRIHTSNYGSGRSKGSRTLLIRIHMIWIGTYYTPPAINYGISHIFDRSKDLKSIVIT